MIRSAVARTTSPSIACRAQTGRTRLRSLPEPLRLGKSEQLHGCERLGRPWPEAVEGEPCLLAGLNIHQDVVVVLLGRLALPIEVRWIVRRLLNARATREDWVLLRPAAAQQQVFHAVDVVHLRGVDVAVEYDHLHVLRVGRDHVVRIIRARDGAEAGAGERRVVESDEDFAYAGGLGFVHPLL